jgi:hypothetical protein
MSMETQVIRLANEIDGLRAEIRELNHRLQILSDSIIILGNKIERRL